MKKYSCAASAALLTMLASCSGSSSTTSISNPSPTNQAPVIELVTNLSSFDEGQTVELDASGSTDADGDPLTFTWSQTAGPTAELTVNGSRASYVLPEVDTDTAVTIQISISDGTVTRSTTSTITSENIVLTPTIDAFGAPEFVLSGVTDPQKIATTPSSTVGSPSAYWMVTGTGTSGAVSFFAPPLLGNFNTGRETPLAEDVSGNVSQAKGIFSSRVYQDFALGFETEGIVRLFRQSFTGQPASEITNFSVPDVCALGRFDGSYYPFLSDLIVGQRGQGLTLFRNNANTGDLDEAGQFDTSINIIDTGTFCHLGAYGSVRELYAYNQDDRIIHSWIATDDTTFVKQPDINLEIPDNVDLVDIEFYIESGGFQLFAALVTNGQHDGDHRVIAQYTPFNGIGTPTRIERSWRKGIPTDLEVLSPATTVRTPDIVVTLSSAPYIIVLENSASSTIGDTEPSFSEVQYFETQLGATAVRQVLNDIEIAEAWIVYKKKGEVEFNRVLKLD